MTTTSNPDPSTFTRSKWQNAKRRRRILLGLALTLITVTWITWRITHRHDPRFVGKWLFTWGTAPSLDELNGTESPAADRLVWTIGPDGTGTLDSAFWFAGVEQHSYSAFSWRTDGECIHVSWGVPQAGWAVVQRAYADIRRILRGERREMFGPPDVYEYSAAVETEAGTQQFVLRFQTASGLQTDDTYYLTRIPAE
jgi:hypothetical protein